MVRDDAWAKWIDATISRYEEPLLMYASRLTGNSEEAQDVVQETFLRLCAQDRSAIDNHLNVWLFSVCRNFAFELRRRRSRMATLNTKTEEDRVHASPGAGEDLLEKQETYAEVLQELSSLPPNQQEVIRLKFQHGLSYREISDVTALTVTNVGFLIHVGLKRIRERLVGQTRELPAGK
jgi:RNA polymerase sigma factor (sigma-70 family)